ncbi:MAG: GH36-type glycosyl hydrolase domain-containing protein [Chitinophagales bacterium]
MKNNPIQEFLTQLRISFLGDSLMHKYDNEKSPLRAELFTSEQMELYAKTLARSHTITLDRNPEQLLKRLAENEEILLEVHNLLTESAKENIRISPASEWLLDNFYLIEEQVYTGKKHLPKGYSKGLPQLLQGPSMGLPRVYDIALELISHSDGRVDLNSLTRFLDAYQEITQLKLGELWAIPIMLRLALIENLRRISAQIAKDRINKNLADYWADQMTETAQKDPKSLILVIADMARYGPPLVSSFVAELTRRLTGKGSALTLPLSWIEQRLSENGLTSNELVHLENQKQASDQVSMSNSIGSLRFLSTNDWREFVEKSSVVERVLKNDKDGIYSRMDFRTRDHYRHIVEQIAKKSECTEQQVAEKAVQFANENAENPGADIRTTHVGYFLIGKGRPQLEKFAQVKVGFVEFLKKTAWRVPFLLYTGTSIFIAIFLSCLLLRKAYLDGLQNGWLLELYFFILFIAASQLSITIINWVITIVVQPHLLPRMDFSEGIPDHSRTLVAVPALFSTTEELEDLMEGLEVRSLANRDENLCFALLTDFPDAKAELLPGEEDLLLLARNKVEALNRKYGRKRNDIFFIFHRKRKFNDRDNIWMGYERKRGKLGELNSLLLGHSNENFSLIVGEESIFSTIKYVLTLDSDTSLPRDAAWKIVATMAHPMNRPGYNEKKGRVTEGYTILQPRIAVSLPHGDSSIYARMHGNEPGIDPYTRAVSDVYQDLFREGSFIGKGIYDVRMFEEVLNGKFPENRILSHDLLEGSYARCGLLGDVQLYEDYPSRYLADMHRRHRWIRGDWQIASWLLPSVPGPGKKMLKNPISSLSRWKIFDNLRRSLVPLALFMMLLYGWLLSGAGAFWTLVVVFIIVSPAVMVFVWEMLRKPEDIIMAQHLMLSLRNIANHFIQHLVNFATISYEAFLNLHAILLTNWRMMISQKKLLQWNPSGNPLSIQNLQLANIWKAMWITSIVSIAIFIQLIRSHPLNLIVALPVLGLWFITPILVWRISLPFKGRKVSLTMGQKSFLHKLARKTWGFFEKFVSEEDNWLPPDNYQESPVTRIAHRTSPTNMGLSLLANLAAYDFGYLSPSELIERTANSMNTMRNLERYRGHFYNWYDTQNLAILAPRYISTVDSGNLTGHLLTLKQGLLGMQGQKVILPTAFEGIRDTMLILMDHTESSDSIQAFKSELEAATGMEVPSLESSKTFLEKIVRLAEIIFDSMKSYTGSEKFHWAQALTNQCHSALKDLLFMVPWMKMDLRPAGFDDLASKISRIPLLSELSRMECEFIPEIQQLANRTEDSKERKWLEDLSIHIVEATRRARERIMMIEHLAKQCVDFSTIEYDFLFDKSQRLLAIGYNVQEHRRDASYYDLLASESRLTTFVGIAQGKLPQESWFALGRQLTNPGISPVLLSWSGSMFEYLMPLLIMPTYENTLLEQTSKASVQKQIDYGKKRGVPWGISESGYNMVDANLNYQYRAFGVPGLGLKRGLSEDVVVSPYSSIMALMVSPEEACKNLYDLADEGFGGRFGFFEAIDYTPARMPRGQDHVIIPSFMVHHLGMSLLSLEYVLLNRPMQQRFENEVQFQAVLLLLQERIPQTSDFYTPSVHVADSSTAPGDVQVRVINTPHTPVPELHLLSNGRYHVMITNAGGSYSRWKDIAVNRWRQDGTCDNWGTFCYIRDLDNDEYWSAAYQPSLKQGENYEAVFSEGRAEFRRRDQNLDTHMEVVVSSEDDVEMRRVRLSNRTRKKRYLEITSYAEVVLTQPMADATHQAFNNLFVQTEINTQRHAIICTRRPRSQDEHSPWMFHLMKVHDASTESIAYETDRAKFIGRGNSVHHPAAMERGASLSGSQGSVLDPIVSIQYRIVIDPHETATVDMVFGLADSREICNGLIEKYQDRPLTDRAFELAWTHSQVVLRQINATVADAQLYAKLAGSVIFANATLRADPATIIKNRRGQSGLWSYSISGDWPIVLLQIQDPANIELVRQMVQAHAYWRLKGMMVDLVIWNEDHGGYRQALQNEITSLISPGVITDVRDKPGGIFIRSADQISSEDRILFQTAAHIVLSDSHGSLEEQINRLNPVKSIVPFFTPSRLYATQTTSLKSPDQLQFFNGLGGFSINGNEYVIVGSESQRTPAPWINVLANPRFGCIVSESGQSYTWIENAHEMRLTPWNNDAVCDRGGELFYLRDEESGRFWSPTSLPSPGKSNYITRHGFGYSVFEYLEDGIYSEMCMYVDIREPIKFFSLKIQNRSGRPRRFSVTGFVEWVLGDLRPKSLMHVTTEIDPSSGAILAKNNFSAEFDNLVAFFDVDDVARTFTTDRSEFIGRNGTSEQPEVMNRVRLSGRWGAAMDPCAAIQVMVDLGTDAAREIIFRLGAGRDANEAMQLARQFKGNGAASDALKKVQQYWKKSLSTIQVQTPDPVINIITNGWLNYQTLASRLWARSGFYQSGGAFGFRDQLQDVLSLLHSQPDLVRNQILLCASRQFKEGDVQHWWHPPSGRGVRTTCSDDFLWLPYVCSRYVKHTGDAAILDETVHFIEGRPLNLGEESYYDLPVISDQTDSLYQHCTKAIDRAIHYGEHGLPLIGSGDWNDGMDKVGNEGKGESVWLAFFLYDVLNKFSSISELKKDLALVSKYKREALQLKKNIEKNAWDGEWYRRAYFDDGNPLGSATNTECKIDSIAQSWSVLSKSGDPSRTNTAMQSAEKWLVRRDLSLIQLFTPPFDRGELNPGYIKGYVPGVRENGGQYTHAAIWMVMAFAALGDSRKTYELLSMINPLNHSKTFESISTYMVEPYVVAADVYAVSEYAGRGGWTWYTGSAGWMYQLIIEFFFGLKREGSRLRFEPCIPREWPSAQIKYHFGQSVYLILLMHSGPNGGVTRVILDAQVQNRNSIDLSNDGKLHQVEVWISERPETEEKKLGGPVTELKSDEPLNK